MIRFLRRFIVVATCTLAIASTAHADYTVEQGSSIYFTGSSVMGVTSASDNMNYGSDGRGEMPSSSYTGGLDNSDSYVRDYFYTPAPSVEEATAGDGGPVPEEVNRQRRLTQEEIERIARVLGGDLTGLEGTKVGSGEPSEFLKSQYEEALKYLQWLENLNMTPNTTPTEEQLKDFFERNGVSIKDLLRRLGVDPDANVGDTLISWIVDHLNESGIWELLNKYGEEYDKFVQGIKDYINGKIGNKAVYYKDVEEDYIPMDKVKNWWDTYSGSAEAHENRNEFVAVCGVCGKEYTFDTSCDCGKHMTYLTGTGSNEVEALENMIHKQVFLDPEQRKMSHYYTQYYDVKTDMSTEGLWDRVTDVFAADDEGKLSVKAYNDVVPSAPEQIYYEYNANPAEYNIIRGDDGSITVRGAVFVVNDKDVLDWLQGGGAGLGDRAKQTFGNAIRNIVKDEGLDTTWSNFFKEVEEHEPDEEIRDFIENAPADPNLWTEEERQALIQGAKDLVNHYYKLLTGDNPTDKVFYDPDSKTLKDFVGNVDQAFADLFPDWPSDTDKWTPFMKDFYKVWEEEFNKKTNTEMSQLIDRGVIKVNPDSDKTSIEQQIEQIKKFVKAFEDANYADSVQYTTLETYYDTNFITETRTSVDGVGTRTTPFQVPYYYKIVRPDGSVRESMSWAGGMVTEIASQVGTYHLTLGYKVYEQQIKKYNWSQTFKWTCEGKILWEKTVTGTMTSVSGMAYDEYRSVNLKNVNVIVTQSRNYLGSADTNYETMRIH